MCVVVSSARPVPISATMSAEAEVKEEMQAEHYEDFMDCARFGEAEGVGIYIEHGADVNWSDSFGTTALHRGEQQRRSAGGTMHSSHSHSLRQWALGGGSAAPGSRGTVAGKL